MSPLSPTSWWHVPLFVRFQDTINNQQSQCLTWYNLATKRKLFWRPSVIKRLPCFAVVTTDTNWNAMSTTIVQDCDMKITEHLCNDVFFCEHLQSSPYTCGLTLPHYQLSSRSETIRELKSYWWMFQMSESVLKANIFGTRGKDMMNLYRTILKYNYHNSQHSREIYFQYAICRRFLTTYSNAATFQRLHTVSNDITSTEESWPL